MNEKEYTQRLRQAAREKQQLNEDFVEAVESIARALHELGFGAKPDSKGAIEGLTVAMVGDDPFKATICVAGALSEIASALNNIAEAIREHGNSD